MQRLTLLVFCLFCLLAIAMSKKKKEEDPRECEVCVSNLDAIDKLIPSDKKSDKTAIEKAISTHCTLSGFGSEWKPNPALATPKDVKMCYIFEPIKKSISQPFATGMPKRKVCERLKKDNPEVCEVKYRKLGFAIHFIFLSFSGFNTRCCLILRSIESREEGWRGSGLYKVEGEATEGHPRPAWREVRGML